MIKESAREGKKVRVEEDQKSRVKDQNEEEKEEKEKGTRGEGQTGISEVTEE